MGLQVCQRNPMAPALLVPTPWPLWLPLSSVALWPWPKLETCNHDCVMVSLCRNSLFVQQFCSTVTEGSFCYRKYYEVENNESTYGIAFIFFCVEQKLPC